MIHLNAKSQRGVALLLTALTLTFLSFLLYFFTLAPGLTWAHFGPDGGELVAAAMVNGVPHPPGYPLYILLLQGWLSIGRLVYPHADLAWLGNLLSAVCASLSVGITTLVGAHVLAEYSSDSEHTADQDRQHPTWIWAAVIGFAWATAPLLWRQAVITEVYALHALLIAILGWALFVGRGHIVWVTIPIGLGLAHHLTFVLLLPGVLYWLWTMESRQHESKGWLTNLIWAGLKLIPALLLGALFYIRIPLAAADGPPINWGYPDNWEGFWWLTTAEAYRSYLFGVPASSVFDRIAAWAYNLTDQFREPGLALALLGLAKWDRERPELRNFGLLWLLPISIYAISYYTSDSTIYLLPCMWLLALWLGVGLNYGFELLRPQNTETADTFPKIHGWRNHVPSTAFPIVALLCLGMLAGYRLPDISLQNDQEARVFVDEVDSMLPPDSIIISSADAETFALWYGVWGSEQLADDGQEPYLINGALLQFPWYQRLVRQQYTDLPGAGANVLTIIQKNQGVRPIYFSEETQGFVPGDALEPNGPLWEYIAVEHR